MITSLYFSCNTEFCSLVRSSGGLGFLLLTIFYFNLNTKTIFHQRENCMHILCKLTRCRWVIKIFWNICIWMLNYNTHHLSSRHNPHLLLPLLYVGLLCVFFCAICWASHLTHKLGTKLFLRWDWAQSHSLHTPGGSENALGPVGILLKRGAPGA